MSANPRRAWSASDVEFARTCRSVPALLWFVDDKERAPLPTWDVIEWQLDHRDLYDLYVISTRARCERAARMSHTDTRIVA